VGRPKDVIDFPGRNPRLRGDSYPPQNVCVTDFKTFTPGESGIRLCQICCVKHGLIWAGVRCDYAKEYAKLFA